MSGHAVVIAGGGPTGMMLAAELTLAGVDVAVVEPHANRDFGGSRAGGLHARTLEVFDLRGIADRFLAQGTPGQHLHFHAPLDMSDLPTRHAYVLTLWQIESERILAGWVDELPVTFHRGCTVSGFAQDEGGVDVALSDGRTLRAQYLVGCDGGRSAVRKAARIDFPGCAATRSWMIAEVRVATEPKWGFHEHADGFHAIGRLDDGRARIVLTEREVVTEGEPSLHDLRTALADVAGTDYGVHSPNWLSRFSDATRQAATYRDRRVLLAGDAAHVHPPHGGQGLNLGVQDAVNLGWKLAQVVRRTSPETLLDSYHAERHPVAARVLQTTQAQALLQRTDARTKALGGIVSEIVALDEPRRKLAAEISGLSVQYDLGDGHPLLGRRMPDLDLATDEGAVRASSLLHAARPVLLDLGGIGGFDIAPWADRVRRIEARYDGAWALPALGTVAAPMAVLVRPDGHVAWVGEGTDAGLADTLTAWFGPAATPSPRVRPAALPGLRTA